MGDHTTVAEVQVDDNARSDSEDSSYDADSITDSASIASSVLKYNWKNGRRYHSDRAGEYSFPNDDEEQDRLDMVHHVFTRLINDRLFTAPIDPEGARVLDIGTGTGLWAIQFGDKHPSAVVIGNDLSPIQPDWVPPNVRFIIDDVEADWVDPVPYDYIHCKYMAGSIKDWPRLIKQAYASLKPGGWIELHETANTLYSEDDSLQPDNALVEMMEHLTVACEKIGRTMDPAPSFKQWVGEAGFESVKEDRFKLPIGPWPKDERLKEIGTLMGINMIEGVAAFTAVLFTEVLGWSRERVELFNARVRQASRQRSVHPIFDCLVLICSIYPSARQQIASMGSLTTARHRRRSKTMLFSNLSAISLLFQGLPGVYSKPTCIDETFKSIKLDNAEILSINANVSSIELPELPTNEWPIPAGSPPINVCKVVVTYTHPGWNDTINAYVWLPISGWNERFVGVGGGGWSTGDVPDLGPPASKGYAAVTTDGGRPMTNRQSMDWALTKSGHLNWPPLQNFAAVALDDATTVGKAVTEAYFGKAPKYSYWNGCSTGGRQGHMMAQRYPTQYNGVLAGASAFNWDRFIVSEYWPQLVMHKLGYYPPACELAAITNAAIKTCDPVDGVEDGIVSDSDGCDFDPISVVGTEVTCDNPSGTIKVSVKAAEIARLTWRGPQTEDGKFMWYGLDKSAPLNGLANTNCTSLTNCTTSPFAIAKDWLSTFILQNPSVELKGMSHAEYSRLFRQSVNRFASVMGSADADLTDFKKAGGKILAWHGTADELIPYKGSVDYYKRVLEGDPEANDYYRFFEAPGVNHCKGGPGWFPGGGFDALVKWVEEGKAPDTLYAETTGTEKKRVVELCVYPKKLTYQGGDASIASSYGCK
uniref:Carboxylic ester hydrolase n=1 Tax=Gibberella zeae TaxID=5518 RepID=A0A4E9EH12_GIBZA